MPQPPQHLLNAWFQSRGWQPFPFQQQVWDAFLAGKHGLLNAPTGSGKTYALGAAPILKWLARDDWQTRMNNGLQLLWITPLKALSKDIHQALTELVEELGLPWQVRLRTGDTSSSERQKMKRRMPEILITTPESLHLLLASKDYPRMFRHLQLLVADEWHELLGTKRGVQVELGLSRLKAIAPDMRIWGISATIGNLEEALEVLLGETLHQEPFEILRAEMEKQVQIETVLPDEMERLPWTGHLGLRLLPKVVPILRESRTTLIFTNTRSQCEIWYQQLLEQFPEFAGVLAIHHGSIAREVRAWVEEALHAGSLKVVVCTSSLDLGVDFRPVETVVQVGSPKGVARFLQRAGRSGHQPGAVSRMFFVPTNALELLEGAALREATEVRLLEDRLPVIKPMDVLCQYLVTLAVSDGFNPQQALHEVRSTFSYGMLQEDEWQWALRFITSGGEALEQYEEYQKVVVQEDCYRVTDRRTALRHRLHIGTIVSDAHLNIKFMKGGSLGTVEESFIKTLKAGDTFIFAGRVLELVKVRGMTVYVRRASKGGGNVPRWAGGRLPLSSQLSEMYRSKLEEYLSGNYDSPELEKLVPLLTLQQERSAIPKMNELLIEQIRTREGYHYFFYPFEGRLVHEGMAALFAWRLAQFRPATFSLAMNDYGFELLTNQPIPLEEGIENGLFSIRHLEQDIQQSCSATEMARRKFRDIATIAGLIFQGYPGSYKQSRHLQASSSLIFDVFREYDPDNLLLHQAYEEVLLYQLEEVRMQKALQRIQKQRLLITKPPRPTPFAFPIMVDRLREKLSTEKLQDRIARMVLQMDK